MFLFLQLANFFKDNGVQKGDTVIIYLPMIMELPITMLACARIGALHSVLPHTFYLYSLLLLLLTHLHFQVVFAGYSAESLHQRVMDCKPKIIITCNAVMRGKKIIDLKNIVDAALLESSQNGISVGGNYYSTLFFFKFNSHASPLISYHFYS